jgi:Uma2 family endonuclease
MATAVLPHVSIETYLTSVYRPDVDYVDGQIEERNLGEYDHGDLQGELTTLFRNHADAWQIRAVPETRVQVAATRFRVPDICIMPLAWKRTPIIHEAPLLCLEVLSPEDRISRVLVRCREFLAMGVREVWVFDPAKRTAQRVTAEGTFMQDADILALAGTPIAIDLPALFAVLDR